MYISRPVRNVLRHWEDQVQLNCLLDGEMGVAVEVGVSVWWLHCLVGNGIICGLSY